ncbi:hypothetical protein C8J57DRAFT_1260883 [Mycena rebaudengoi]|nr:hypothetical protein C8J57DRAFT_1260883 [Mycena rebaudengoi]
MTSSTSAKNRLLTECQLAKQELNRRRQEHKLRNEKARLRMAAYVLHLKTANYANTESRKRAELKKRSPEEQQLYAERACASQAKYRENQLQYDNSHIDIVISSRGSSSGDECLHTGLSTAQSR